MTSLSIPFVGIISLVIDTLVAAQPSLPTVEEYERTGLHLLRDCKNHTVDIVAVHGLDGHWRHSWTAENGVFWLQDLLPDDLPTARIFSFGHDSRSRGTDKPLTFDISEIGKDLVADLVFRRQATETDEKTPIIFIGHSLGELVIKSALVYSFMAVPGYLEHLRSILTSTSAVFYLGTPHQGGEGVDLLEVVTRVFSFFSYTNPKLLNLIKPKSEWLDELQARYNSISANIHTVFFYEKMETSIPMGRKLGAVNSESVALAADHVKMAKYREKNDPNFRKISDRLLFWASRASEQVSSRWDSWSSDKAAVDIGGSAQNKKHHTAPAEFQVGLFLNRDRNIHFSGRQETLATLDCFLHPESPNGPAAAVLFGIGGIGKTEITLEYAYRYRSRFSIFWIDGSTKETAADSIETCLKTISRHYDLNGLGTSNMGRIISLALSKRDGAAGGEYRNTIRIIFHMWLSLDDNRSWLLIINIDDLEQYN
ncbi:protein SERAC1 [Podospora fimiseda]|uniref:Protein SERAC1 n=1 Tax=Podospora fimiseda TaxID=252190 RepID=A0AAN7GZK1_9PEZI|nr:protein SERAC1 [Podospora fimiseda]